MARRRFTKEYKQEAVSLVQQSDIPVAEIARNLGINDNMLRRWVKAGFEIQTIADESSGLTALVRTLKRKLLVLGAGAVFDSDLQMPPGLSAFDLAGIKFWLDRFESEVEKGTIRYLRFNMVML